MSSNLGLLDAMNDEELDRNWKPNGCRPQSTIARSFSQELMDIFRIEHSVADLDLEVAKKKQQVSTQTSELQALEQRIRDMEKRLKQTAGTGVTNGNSASSRTPQRLSVKGTFQQDATAGSGTPKKIDSLIGTAKQNAHQKQHAVAPGGLPPTPVASEGEYELLPRHSPRGTPNHQPWPSGAIHHSPKIHQGQHQENRSPCSSPCHRRRSGSQGRTRLP